LAAWLDCNDGELAGLLAMDEVSSDANAAFETPNVLSTNKTIKIDFAEHIELPPRSVCNTQTAVRPPSTASFAP